MDKLNITVSQHEVTTLIHGNTTHSLRDQMYRMEQALATLEGNTTNLSIAVSEGSRNHTLVVGGLRALEKHFIDVKKDMFETRLNVVSMNDTITQLGERDNDLLRMRDKLAETNDGIVIRLDALGKETNVLRADVGALWNNTVTLSNRVQGLAQNVSDNADSFSAQIGEIHSVNGVHHKALERASNRTNVLEVGITGLMNYSVEVQGNLSRLLVFAAENKAEILELKVADTNLEDKIDEIFDLHDIHTTRVTQTKGLVQANLTRLEGMTSAIESDMATMTARYQTLETLFTNYAKSAGDLEIDVERLKDGHVKTKNDLETVKFDLDSVRAEASGVEVFVNSIQKHVSTLTSNMTSMNANLTNARTEIDANRGRLNSMGQMMDLLSTNITENRNGLIIADEQFQILRLNSSTLKANILGLGNYINNINTDLGKLASTFEKYISNLSEDIDVMAENVTSIEGSLRDETSEIRTLIQAVELANANLKGEAATLTTKTYSMKTTLFEQQNEMSALRADLENLNTDLQDVEQRFETMQANTDSANKEFTSMRSDVSTLRTGLTGLTNSLFNLKAQILDTENVESRVNLLATNLTAVSSDVRQVKLDMKSVKPTVERFNKEMNTVRQSLDMLETDVAVQKDPTRFSCAVTSDEIRVSGVITYNICNVNTGDIMNRETGHVSIKESGDYFLTFSSNMVSVNSQAVWCALYKQSAGNEGWQVLGMINNYQRNADKIDDRDSGSLTLITPLKAGDQVWVEWRGYGESFLYSNPYRLISFSGFMLKKS